MKVLLIQAREPSDKMRKHEYDCFVARTGLAPENVLCVNAYESSNFPVQDAAAVFIGGSGAYSATAKYPWMDPVLETIRECRDVKKPLFGSCWGFHMIGRAFGAPVITDEASKELGTLPVRLTKEAKKDPIFSQLPDSFLVQLGHKDNVSAITADFVNLARSDKHNQAFCVKDAPIYATQFHPELMAEDMRIRLNYYIDHGYVTDAERASLQEIMKTFQDSPEAAGIIPLFLKTFCS